MTDAESVMEYEVLNTSPLAEEAREFLTSCQGLPKTPVSNVVRGLALLHLFDDFERCAANYHERPTDGFRKALVRMTQLVSAWGAVGFDQDSFKQPENNAAVPAASEDVATVTGTHYGKLFARFNPTSFWDEPKKLLGARLRRNEIDASRWTSKSVLDAGCGGGRYTAAWKALGAGNCVGLDYSKEGIESANERLADSPFEGVEFVQGNVLSLPFENDSFEVVFSNGVLHHTTDWVLGVNEIVRTLRPGGLGWLYLIERPGGLFWDMIELLRAMAHGHDRAAFRQILNVAGVPANRIFYVLDHVMVPINLRLTPEEVESALVKAGASDVRRLTRGTDFDRVEHIFQGHPYAVELYGAGENRYVFSK